MNFFFPKRWASSLLFVILSWRFLTDTVQGEFHCLPFWWLFSPLSSSNSSSTTCHDFFFALGLLPWVIKNYRKRSDNPWKGQFSFFLSIHCSLSNFLRRSQRLEFIETILKYLQIMKCINKNLSHIVGNFCKIHVVLNQQADFLMQTLIVI